MCLDVNQGGTNPNRCTQRLAILHALTYLMNPDHTPKNYVSVTQCDFRFDLFFSFSFSFPVIFSF